MKRFVCFLIILLSFVFTVKAEGEKAQVLQSCEKLFGKTLDEKLNLFEVNQLFVLQPEFNEKGFLVKISVEPKYFYEEEHPEWKEPKERPHLANADYADVIAKINSIKPLGKFLNEVFNGAVTNSTVYTTEYFKDSILDYGETPIWQRDAVKEFVRFIRITYFQDVEGRIKKKKSCSFCFGVKFLVNVGEETNYYVEEETYNKLKKGKTATFRGILSEIYNIDNFGKKPKPFNIFKTKKD
jgi:hypothetical protein